MTSSIIGTIVLAVVAIVFGWLASRAWRARGAAARWLGGIFASLFTLILVALTVVGALGTYKLFRSNIVSVPDVTVSGTPAQVARGEHLAVVLCSGCHSLTDDLPLTGGKNLSEDAGMPLGDIFAPNITPAGDIKDMNDTQLFRLLRTGVSEEGRATAMAAVTGPQALSDEDTLAVIAYLRQSPALENETPVFNPTVLMALLAGAGLVKVDPPSAVTSISAPEKAATVAYGEYVVAYMDCKSCHGQKLDGNVPPPVPPGPNLQADFLGWSKEQFLTEISNHLAATKPGEIMPWKDVSRLDDVELEALYLYLHDFVSK
jgi:mono/diheme cytochrome c family protein